jgi:hypothetical protein
VLEAMTSDMNIKPWDWWNPGFRFTHGTWVIQVCRARMKRRRHDSGDLRPERREQADIFKGLL